MTALLADYLLSQTSWNSFFTWSLISVYFIWLVINKMTFKTSWLKAFMITLIAVIALIVLAIGFLTFMEATT